MFKLSKKSYPFHFLMSANCRKMCAKKTKLSSSNYYLGKSAVLEEKQEDSFIFDVYLRSVNDRGQNRMEKDVKH